MARVAVDDPIFRTKTGQVEFTQDMQNPGMFKTTMPGATYFDALGIDQAAGGAMDMTWDGGTIDQLGDKVQGALADATDMREAIQRLVESQAGGIIADLQELGALDMIQSTRAIVGQVATTVGFLPQNMRNDVRGTYLEPLHNVVVALDIANKVINSEYFQQAVDAIAWIPIVGWIIKIVVEVLTLVLNIAAKVREKNIKEMSYELAARFHLPLMSGDPSMQSGYNQLLTRQVLSYTSDYALWKVFQPPFLIPDGSGKRFETVAAADPDGTKYDMGEGNPEITLTQAWYLRGIKSGSPDIVAPAGGSGFIPGGSTLFRALEFTTQYGGEPPRNIGNFANTARQTAAFLWQTVLKPGPSMFAVNTGLTTEHWDNFLHGMLEYGERCILKGFTVSESSVLDTHRWGDCTDMEWVYKDEYKGDKAGTKRHFPGGWGHVHHFSEMLTYLAQQFWGRGADQNSFPYPLRDPAKDAVADQYFYHNTVYAHALKNLRERQIAVAQGYEAFSVFPGEEMEDTLTGAKVRREGGIFPAFGSAKIGWDNGLINTWEDTIRAVLGDKTLWQNLDWRDVPQYRWKGQSVREILKAKQGGGQGGMKIAMPGTVPPVPGGPEMFPPPGPPSLVGQNATGILLPEREEISLEPGGVFPKIRGGVGAMPTASKAMLAAAAAMGAVVGANELYRQVRRRRYFAG